MTSMNYQMKYLLRTTKFFLFLLLLIAATVSKVIADDFPDKPNPPKLVNDYVNKLSPGHVTALENKLRAYNDSTSTQIAIVIIASTEGYDISDYSFQLAEKWGIGQKDKDNGVLITVAVDDRKTFIATGYGMEEFVTDATAKRIIENYMLPSFKKNDFYNGLNQATTIIMGLAAGQFTAEDIAKENTPGLGVLVFPLLFFGILFLINYARFRNYKSNSITGDMSFWMFLMLMSQNRSRGRGHRGGGFGNFSSGGGSFGGFGGGSFGGGGAGGSW